MDTKHEFMSLFMSTPIFSIIDADFTPISLEDSKRFIKVRVNNIKKSYPGLNTEPQRENHYYDLARCKYD